MVKNIWKVFPVVSVQYPNGTINYHTPVFKYVDPVGGRAGHYLYGQGIKGPCI